MATNILMPALSPTMTEGTLARWLKKEGDTIKAGEVIAEIETDKATMEVEAVDEGVLGRILVSDGTEGVKVNDPIAILVDVGEDVPAGAAPARAAPVAAPIRAPITAVIATPAAVAMELAVSVTPANGHSAGERIFASPLARRMALQAGIELSSVRGSGPNGRIVRADIEAVRKTAPSAGAPRVLAPAAASGGHTKLPNSSIRKVIARRLTESKSTVPHFYVSMDIELDALLKLRADLNARAPAEGAGAYRLSVNDFVIKAAGMALRRVPKVNASWTEDHIILYNDVDISVAVAIPGGLITPIIRRADEQRLFSISNAMKDLSVRARGGKLTLEEFQGGGFSVSNMGMYGVSKFAAIINPPQAAILAVAAGQQRPVVKDGALAVATMMTCTLSVDHRVVDGALGAEWLGVFKTLMEDPLSLLL
ncbi:MAG: pyruvate dehydrogenase complex dihydrolipoamide acetyltransferase [Acetobacteraceae bacterium]|nr:pyruvate dehydrogenase complex dihydrolipoamide acetyltransferase [Acetobacteraceae bacterium]MSP29505.1 pyruvate dehydrogenase complex dihydrolipoamide acetyltransferase [Acetobacteraceae bacterium]